MMMSRYQIKIISHPFCCYATFLLLALVLQATVVQSYSALRDRWSLPDVPISFEFFDDDSGGGLDFVFVFPISRDVATDDNIDIRIYDKGCKYNDGESPVELTTGTSEELVFPASMATSTAPTVMTSLEVTLGNSRMNVASMLQEYPSLWNEEQSQISFCLRFSLMTEDIEVNFLETVVVLGVTLVGVGFRIDEAAVEPKEKIETISRVSYEVMAYLCDGRYRPLRDEMTGLIEQLYEVCDGETGEIQTVTETTTTTTVNEGQVYEQELSEAQKVEQENITYPQGSVVRVCIRPDDTVLGQVSMRTIKQLVFEGTVVPQIAESIIAVAPTTYLDKVKGIYTQVAVEDGDTNASSGLSYMSCENDRMEGRPDVVVCAVDTILVAAFYWRTPGIVASVIAKGIAVLKFGASDDEVEANRGREKTLRRTDVVGGNNDEQLPLLEQPELEVERRQAQEAVSLEKYWNMARPKVDYSGIDEPGGGFDFNMEYKLSDAIAEEMIHMEVWKKSCQQIGMEPELEYSTEKQSVSDLLEMTSTTAYETGDGSGSQTVIVSGRWKREDSDFAPMLTKSEYYKENSDGTLVQISLCVRYQLHTKKSDGGIEVNFLETPVIVNIDLKAGIDWGLGFTLVSNEDQCLDELLGGLQTMSGGKGGLDNLYSSGLYWAPGGQSADPTMPMGPSMHGLPSSYGGYSSSSSSSSYGSASYSGGGASSSWSSDNSYKLKRSSANAFKHSLTITMTMIGVFIFFLLPWI
jgi:uncharacterized membrane protein YgcG